jgi:hypothetical protein
MDGCAALAMGTWILFNPPVTEHRIAPGIDFWES